MPLLGLVQPDDADQALRIRRFLLAATVYAATIGLMALYLWLGYMDLHGFAVSTGLAVAVNAIILAFLRSGRNQRFRDPSLTDVQMLGAAVVLAISMYYVDAARGALLLLFVVLLMFGAFRLHRRRFMLIGTLAWIGYAAAVWAAHRVRGAPLEPRAESLHLIALAVLIVWGGLFAEYAAQLRRQIRVGTVELQRMHKAYHDLSELDDLTGVSNRRTILQSLDEELERASRLEAELSVCLVDLDRFQQVNLRHGTAAGDAVLREVAAELTGLLRPVDTLGRFAAEEFLLVLPDTGLQEAIAFAERLRNHIDHLRFPEIDRRLHITASLGVVSHHSRDTGWTMIDCATRAASQALAAGGNRVAWLDKHSDTVRLSRA